MMLRKKIVIGIVILLSCFFVYWEAKNNYFLNIEIPWIKNSIAVRPITIKVVDEITKEPIRNVPVLYMLSSEHITYTIILFIPNIETNFNNKYEQTYWLRTDENGTIKIPRRTIKINWPREISDELVMINLDFNKRQAMIENAYSRMKPMMETGTTRYLDDLAMYSASLDQDYLINPVSRYKGFVIHSNITGLKQKDAEKMKTTIEVEKLGKIMNYPASLFKKDGVNMVIELPRNNL
ncbi:MAG TPA: hypothetical protein VIS94_02885 [Desulfomonilia bacterium]